MDPLGKRAAVEPNARVGQPLMLAIERQVIGEFVDQQTRQQTDIRHTLLEHRRRCRWTADLLGLLEFDDLAHVLEHHIGPGLLRQPPGYLLADDLIGLRRQACHCRIGHRNYPHRH